MMAKLLIGCQSPIWTVEERACMCNFAGETIVQEMYTTINVKPSSYDITFHRWIIIDKLSVFWNYNVYVILT